ncbi:MAG: O-antigen ligase family protein [Pseudobdellovibrionaceae bacterium]
MEKILSNKVLAWLWGLFAFSVLVSQSAMDLFSTLLCLWAILFTWQHRSAENSKGSLFPKIGIEPLWAIWIVIVAIGFILHPMDLQYALLRLVEFKWIFIFYVLFGTCIYLKPKTTTLLTGASLALIFLSLFSLLTYFYPYGILKDFGYDIDTTIPRLGGFFANPMTFAHSMVIPFFIIFTSLFYTHQKKQVFLYSISSALLFMCLMLSLTRGIWIALFLSLSLFLFIRFRKFLLLFIVLAFGLFGMLYSSNNSFKSRIDESISELNHKSERKLIWKAHFLVFKENPIFGLGYGQNSKKIREYYDRLGYPEGVLQSHAHNQYLHLLAGTGILGAGIYILIISIFLRWSWILFKKISPDYGSDKGLAFGAFLAQVAFYIGSLTEANFEHSKVRFMLMILWSMVVYLGFKYNIKPYKYGFKFSS